MVHSQVSIVKLKYLSDLKGRIGWQNLTTNEYTTDGAYLVAGIHLENGIINWDSCYHISEERYEMDSNIQLQNNDLLITKAGTIGKLGIVTNLKSHATINSALVIIRPKSPSKYFTKYLYYFLSSFYFQKWFLTVIKPYSTILNLSQKELSNLPIFLCSLSEQQELISFLDRKSHLIQELLQKIDLLLKKLEDYQEALLYDTLVYQKTPTTIIKLKYLSTLKGRIGWQALTTQEYQQQGAYLVTGVNIQQGVIDWSSCHHVSIERYEMDLNIQLKEQDLIITKDGTIGKVAIIQNLPSIATLNSHLILIRSKSKGVYFEKYL